tara:strand:+ start:464 stop:739 length:276 start_codon:yes stop_codon:yes gene_type:complete
MSEIEKYGKAVRELYSSVAVIRQDYETKIYTSEDNDGNVIEVNNSAVEAKIIEMQTAEDNKETAKAEAKVSAVTKLKALGLDEAELKTLGL